MKDRDCTTVINRRLNQLKGKLHAAPMGGGLENLKGYLCELRNLIYRLELEIDRFNNVDINEGAAPGDVVSGNKLRNRVQYNEGSVKCGNSADKPKRKRSQKISWAKVEL